MVSPAYTDGSSFAYNLPRKYSQTHTDDRFQGHHLPWGKAPAQSNNGRIAPIHTGTNSGNVIHERNFPRMSASSLRDDTSLKSVLPLTTTPAQKNNPPFKRALPLADACCNPRSEAYCNSLQGSRPNRYPEQGGCKNHHILHHRNHPSQNLDQSINAKLFNVPSHLAEPQSYPMHNPYSRSHSHPSAYGSHHQERLLTQHPIASCEHRHAIDGRRATLGFGTLGHAANSSHHNRNYFRIHHKLHKKPPEKGVHHDCQEYSWEINKEHSHAGHSAAKFNCHSACYTLAKDKRNCSKRGPLGRPTRAKH